MANIIVLFEVKPTKAGMKKYLDLAAMLKPLLAGFEGFIRAERFSSLNEDGKLLSMNIWTGLFPRKVNVKPLFYLLKKGNFFFLMLFVQIKGKIFLPLEP